jgi:hypothetical protein
VAAEADRHEQDHRAGGDDADPLLQRRWHSPTIARPSLTPEQAGTAPRWCRWRAPTRRISWLIHGYPSARYE